MSALRYREREREALSFLTLSSELQEISSYCKTDSLISIFTVVKELINKSLFLEILCDEILMKHISKHSSFKKYCTETELMSRYCNNIQPQIDS